MPLSSFPRAALSSLALAALLAACGGGDTDTAVPADAREQIQKGGDCTGSCTGGGGTPVPGVNPLPTSAPAPGILVRESFGPGPTGVRPKGGKGDLRSTFVGTTLGGFWVEWPGSKANAWITPAGEATWKFSTTSANGANPNPYELPSPLQTNGNYGEVGADLTDGVTGGYPTALLPVAWPATPWAVSVEAAVSQLAGSYIALGLTDSSATLANLATVSKVTLLLRTAPDGLSMQWELWQAGTPRTRLASGSAEDLGYNQLLIAYVPQSQTLSVSVNGVAGGSFALNLGVPRYAAFEGRGAVDDFVVRSLGTP